MTDHRYVKAARTIDQDRVQHMVSRVMEDRMREKTVLNEIEHKLVKAVYNPDKRMR